LPAHQRKSGQEGLSDHGFGRQGAPPGHRYSRTPGRCGTWREWRHDTAPVMQSAHPGGFWPPGAEARERQAGVFLTACRPGVGGGFRDDLAGARKVYAPAHAGSVDRADLE